MQGNGGNLSLISGREIGSCLDHDIYIHINGIFHIKNDEWSRLKNEDNYHGADSYHGDRDQVLVPMQSEEWNRELITRS